MASSPKKGGERADSLESLTANEPTSSDPTEASEAPEDLSRQRMAAFRERLRALLSAKEANPHRAAPITAETAPVPDDVPRDANRRIINPGGRMILTHDTPR